MSKKNKLTAHSRAAGVLMHVTSLPGRFGIGDLGPTAHAFVDALARAGQSWWQILPLGPPGSGGSPYQSFSAVAGNPDLISPEALVEDGLLTRADLRAAAFAPGAVDFERVGAFKTGLLARAWERFNAGAARTLRAAFDKFRQGESDALSDYALFMAIRESQGGAYWLDWPRELRLRDEAALRTVRRDLADAVDRHLFAQFLFFRQLEALRAHAAERGVRLIGDVPIFVSGDSADVWGHPHLFLLDRDRRPKFVAGVPPDYFSATGQRWGNPLYGWRAMEREKFSWWVNRVRATLRQVDLVRIDHFRGFAACWTIPASEPTAVKGRWVKAPGEKLFEVLRRELGDLPFIAEDLGVITPDVEALRDGLHLPGMRVLQFAFGGGADSPYLPHNYVKNAVAYTGTHDNDTTAGWYAALDRKTRAHAQRYLGLSNNASPADAAWAMIRATWSSVTDLAIAPVQDVLGLGSAARMNTPGIGEGNWGWRLTALPDRKRLDQLGEVTEAFGRAP